MMTKALDAALDAVGPKPGCSADLIRALRQVDDILSYAADRGVRAKPTVKELNSILDIIRTAIAKTPSQQVAS